MAENNDTLLRLITMLQIVPEYPRRITSTELLDKLEDRGYEISQRSVQRDLIRLSTVLPLTHSSGRPKEWSFVEGRSIFKRELSPASALALMLGEQHLQKLLPQSVLNGMRSEFRRASHYLATSSSPLAHWPKRVRAMPNGKSLLPAQLSSGVWQSVSQALLKGLQLEVSYHARGKDEPKTLRLHPAGIISRHAVSYLIAKVDGYDDYRQFAMQRMTQVSCLTKPADTSEDFDVDGYIRRDFNTDKPIQSIKLKADIAGNLAWLLQETPLAAKQKLTPLQDGTGWWRLEATVPDDNETRWWVFGLGENIKVHAPATWVDEIKQRIASVAKLYNA